MARHRLNKIVSYYTTSFNPIPFIRIRGIPLHNVLTETFVDFVLGS